MANKNSPVGFFDSGVGGLSVYARFRELLPNEDTIYFGDLKNLPYGNKSQSELVGFAKKILDFFSMKDVKAVVIACNTSSALAYESIKKDYDFKIYPIIQSSAHLIAEMGLSKIGVFATEGTVKSGAYKKEIQKHSSTISVNEIACPNWVSIVEGLIDNADNDIEKHIKEMLDYAPDKIVLGCTHYPYLLSKLTKFLPAEKFIDPAKIFVDFVSNDIEKNNKDVLGNEEFYVSANPEGFVKNAELFYKIDKLPFVI